MLNVRYEHGRSHKCLSRYRAHTRYVHIISSPNTYLVETLFEPILQVIFLAAFCLFGYAIDRAIRAILLRFAPALAEKYTNFVDCDLEVDDDDEEIEA